MKHEKLSRKKKFIFDKSVGEMKSSFMNSILTFIKNV